jgi:carbon storage regulator
MLILGRKVGDSILIEGGIRIVVVSCDRGGVRIGIDAPAETKILRGEIAQQVASENQRATANTATHPAASAWLAALGAPASATTSAATSTSETADESSAIDAVVPS